MRIPTLSVALLLGLGSVAHAQDTVSPAVPFSLAKSIGKQYEMAVATQGASAKSSITEEPQEVQGRPKPEN